MKREMNSVRGKGREERRKGDEIEEVIKGEEGEKKDIILPVL